MSDRLADAIEELVTTGIVYAHVMREPRNIQAEGDAHRAARVRFYAELDAYLTDQVPAILARQARVRGGRP